MALTIFTFFCAAAPIFRFNVLVLAPAILLGWIFVLASTVFTDSSGISILLKLVVVGLAAQTGYMAGVAVMCFFGTIAPFVTVQRQWAALRTAHFTASE
jgi:hypothetical protein